LRIRQWDFNWQGDYRYNEPVFLPKGTTVTMEFTYDNSTNNIRNPNQPPQRVRYGLRSTDEMGELWFQVIARNSNDLATISRDCSDRLIRDDIAYNEYLLRIDPRDATAHTELGRLKLIRGQSADAAGHFRTALEIKPTSDEAHYYLGVLFRQQRKPGEARSEFENALRLNPDNFKAHGNLGVIFAEQGDAALAEAHFRSALRINPDDSLAQECLNELLKAKAARKQRN
jgi:tetratricopeptide (TPR) repeat protein